MTKLLRYTAVAALSAAVALTSACGGAETRKLKYEQKGAEYFAERNYTKAQLEYRNALQIDPKDAELRFRVGQVSEKLGNPREAMGQYQAAIDLDPKHAAARAAIARLFLLGGLTDKAMELIEPGLAQDPKNPDLLTARAAARSRLGNIQGAFEDAEAANKTAPGNEYTVAVLASLYTQSARSDKAIEIVRAGLDKNPKSLDLHVILADLELKQDHPDKAEEALKQVLAIAPEDLSNHYRLARFYLMRKDVDSAEKAVRGAVAAVPDKLEPKMALIDFLASQRGVDQAESELQKLIAKDRDNDDLRLALGKFYESHGKADAAEKTYRAIISDLDKKPAGLAARDRLAALLLQKKDISQAEKLIGEVLHENARDNDALVMRGNISLARGDTAAAIVDLRTVLRDQPNAVPVMRALARAHAQNNELSLAEETLRSGVEQNPADADLRMDLAQLLIQERKPEQARPLLEKLASELPTNITVLESLFRVEASQKDFDAARTTADTIKRVRPEMGLGSYLAGLVEEATQKPDAAVKEYEHALELQPDAAEPLLAAVRLDLARKDTKKALDRLDSVIARKPENVVAQNAKGELLLSQGRNDDAAASFGQAIEKAPQWWIPYRNLAYTQLAAKKSDAAVEALQRGIDKTNGAPTLVTELAALHEKMGHTDEAIKVYEQALVRDPKSTVAANNLAMLLVNYKTDKKDLDRAGQLVDKLANSTEPALLDTRGWVKFKAGQPKEALPLLQQAVEKAPNAPVLRYHLAMVQLKSGDKESARKNLEAAVGTGKPFDGLDEARAALEEVKRS